MKRKNKRPRTDVPEPAPPPLDLQPLFYAALVFTVAFVVRLIYLNQIEGIPYFDYLVLDPRQYDELARNLASGKDLWRFSLFYQAPAYAYFLAAIYKLLGTGHYAAHVVQIAVGALGVSGVYLLGRRWFGHKTALLASALLTFYGPMLFYEGDFYREPFLAAALVFLALALERALEKRRIWRWLLVGLLLAVCVLTRESILLFLPGLLYFAGGGTLSAGERVKGTLALLIPLVVMLNFVAQRNAKAEGVWTFVSSQGGMNFFMGNTAEMDKLTTLLPGSEYDRLSQRPLNEAGITETQASSNWFYGQAFHYILHHPWSWIKLMVKKADIFWGAYEFMPNEDIRLYRQHSWLLRGLLFRWHGFSFPFGVIAPLALLGVLLSASRGSRISAGLILIYAFSIIAFHTRARYRIPVIPFFCLLAAAGCVQSFVLIRERAWPRLGRAAILTLLAAILINARFYDFSYAEPFPSHYFLAKYYLDNEDPQRALPEYQLAMKDGLYLAEVYYDTGILLWNTNHLPQAAAALEESARLAPWHVKIQLTLGNLYNKVGRVDRAEAHIRQAVHDNAYDPKAHLELGKLLIKKNPAEAEQEFRRVIALGKVFPETGFDTLQAATRGLWRLGKTDVSDAEAIPGKRKQAYLEQQTQDLDRVTRGADLSTKEGRIQASDAYTNQGVAYMRMNQYPEAEKCFLKSLDISYEQTPAHANLGLVYHRMKKFDKAISHYRQALRILPDNYVVLNNLGRAYEDTGKFSEAATYYEKALRLEPTNLVVQHNLERVRAKAGMEKHR